MKFCIKYFFNKCDQIRTKLRIWSHTEEILYFLWSYSPIPSCSVPYKTGMNTFNTFTKFSQKLTFFAPWYASLGLRIRGKKWYFFRRSCIRTKWIKPNLNFQPITNSFEINFAKMIWLKRLIPIKLIQSITI